jgi:tetratricopeptide (TPR) repeat protein
MGHSTPNAQRMGGQVRYFHPFPSRGASRLTDVLTRRFLLVSGLVVTLTVGGGLALRHTPAPRAVSVPVSQSPDADLAAFTTKTRQRLDRVPGDWTAWAALGMGYVQLARVSADPAHYGQAEAALQRSLALQPAQRNAAALTGQAALAAARHKFRAAVHEAQSAVRVDPYSADAWGALADGLIELGRYSEGIDAVQKMVDLRPDTGSYARASYTYELRGQLPRARELMNLALQAAAGPAETSFALQHLSELAFAAGDLDDAYARANDGLARYPGHPPLLAARARAEAARGDTTTAITDLRTAIAKLPQAGYAVLLGDLQAAAGDAAAADSYALVTAARQLAIAQSNPPDIDVILYEADHGEATTALADARALYATRPSNPVADALAWALHSAGQDTEALRYANQALHLGSRDALTLYHRAMIHLALADRDAARADLTAALAANPHFSTRHADQAAATLRTLGTPA